MYKILSLVLAAATTVGTLQAAQAAPAPRLALDISTTSYHTRQWARDSLNQDNPGLGLEYQLSGDWGLAAGEYRNSYRRTSFYALAAWTPLRLALSAGWHLAAGLDAGAITGYTRAEAPARPLMASALLEVRSPQGWGINLVDVPNMGRSAGFIGLQLVLPL